MSRFPTKPNDRDPEVLKASKVTSLPLHEASLQMESIVDSIVLTESSVGGMAVNNSCCQFVDRNCEEDRKISLWEKKRGRKPVILLSYRGELRRFTYGKYVLIIRNAYLNFKKLVHPPKFFHGCCHFNKSRSVCALFQRFSLFHVTVNSSHHIPQLLVNLFFFPS